jgi:hypothetical protein
MRAWWLPFQRHARSISDKLGDFLNITLYYRGGFFDIRVLDVITLLGGVLCVVWYYLTQGLAGALQGGMLYLFIALCALWFFPSNKAMK